MGGLVRMELYKLVHNKWIAITAAALIPLYLFLTHSHYKWNESAIAWERLTLFPYSFGAVFQGLILLLALTESFTGEYQRGTDALLLSSKYGRSRLIQAKITAALLLTTVVVAGCWLLNGTVNLYFAGWTGWDWPIQQLSRYPSSPYGISIWQYVIVQFLTNWLGCIVYALFILLLSVRSSSSLTVLFIAGVTFVLPFFIRNTSDLSVAWLLKNLLMIDFMRVENIFNRPRQLIIADLLLPLPWLVFYGYMLVLAALLTAATYRTFQQKQAC